MQFSEKLKKLRQENNLTQAELADKLYVTRQAVTKWENGRGMPETNIALEIAKLFNVSLDYLMDDTQEKLKDDISNDIKATKKPKKLRPLIKAIILGASLICITGCVLIGSLIYYKHKEDRFEKQEHTIGYYITINEMHTYTIEEILDKDIPCVFSNWLDVNMLDQRKYIYDNEIYIPKKNNVYLYEINYII
ncbi:MAG: helix-turn-helix domain-containing protein [Anaeroplasmataceae bacterium]|nr:helix-turn-helix domain-containing protein [Anaeroplasmataceae bacterium]